MSISRKILVTAAAGAAAAALAAGCGGEDEEADVARAPAVTQSASTEQVDLHAAAAPETPEPAPITNAETRWREHVEAYAERLDAELGRSGVVTHTAMRRSMKIYGACATMLSRAGDPGRFAEVAPQVERACDRLAKAARLLGKAVAASGTGGIVLAGTPEEHRFQQALNGAIEASGNAQYDLRRALEKAAAIKAELEA